MTESESENRQINKNGTVNANKRMSPVFNFLFDRF
jgi:hypothetical protein